MLNIGKLRRREVTVGLGWGEAGSEEVGVVLAPVLCAVSGRDGHGAEGGLRRTTQDGRARAGMQRPRVREVGLGWQWGDPRERRKEVVQQDDLGLQRTGRSPVGLVQWAQGRGDLTAPRSNAPPNLIPFIMKGPLTSTQDPAGISPTPASRAGCPNQPGKVNTDTAIRKPVLTAHFLQ